MKKCFKSTQGKHREYAGKTQGAHRENTGNTQGKHMEHTEYAMNIGHKNTKIFIF